MEGERECLRMHVGVDAWKRGCAHVPQCLLAYVVTEEALRRDPCSSLCSSLASWAVELFLMFAERFRLYIMFRGSLTNTTAFIHVMSTVCKLNVVCLINGLFIWFNCLSRPYGKCQWSLDLGIAASRGWLSYRTGKKLWEHLPIGRVHLNSDTEWLEIQIALNCWASWVWRLGTGLCLFSFV